MLTEPTCWLRKPANKALPPVMDVEIPNFYKAGLHLGQARGVNYFETLSP